MSRNAISKITERLEMLCVHHGEEALRAFEQMLAVYEQRATAPEPAAQLATPNTLVAGELMQAATSMINAGRFAEAEVALLEAKRVGGPSPEVFRRLSELFFVRAQETIPERLDEPSRLNIGVDLPARPDVAPYRFTKTFNEGEDPIFGRFWIIREIGRGERYVVLHARDNRSCLGREVALMVMLDQDPSNENWRESVKEFASRWQGVGNPDIVRFEDLLEIGDTLLYVVEYIEGGGQPRVDVQTIIEFLPRACDALVELEQGRLTPGEMVRDKIKPTNSGTPAVAAFGQALSGLVTGVPVPSWLETTIARCKGGAADFFKDAREVRRHVWFMLRPEEADRVEISVSGNSSLQYTIRRNDAVRPDAGISVPGRPVIDDLKQIWNRLGERASQREHRRLKDRDHAVHDQEIGSLFKQIQANSPLVLGESVTSELAIDPTDLHDRDPLVTFTLMHDPELTAVPWEILGEPEAWCLKFPMSRVPKLGGHFPKWSGALKRPLKVVLAADESVEYCAEEIESLARQFSAPEFVVQKIYRSHGPVRFRQAVRDCDILHFACHGHDDANPAMSGPSLGDDILHGISLKSLWKTKAPAVVFANCCFLARAGAAETPWWLNGQAGHGFAHEVCNAGAVNFIGSVLRAPHSPRTIEFAEVFYKHLLSGRAISQAILEARVHSYNTYERGDFTWARYILFGNPFTIIRTFSGHGAAAAAKA